MGGPGRGCVLAFGYHCVMVGCWGGPGRGLVTAHDQHCVIFG
jgi:hypothetical protein